MAGRFTYESSWGAGSPSSLAGAGAGAAYANIFRVTSAGWAVGVRYFRTKADGSEHEGRILLEADNSTLAICKFPLVAAAGTGKGTWQHCYFAKRVKLTVGTLYYAMASFGTGRVYSTSGALASVSITTGHIVEPVDSTTHWNGQFCNSYDFNTFTNHAAGVRYGVDVLALIP